MCDYSIEMYGNRPAVAGERYVTHRFPSSTIGFVSEADPAKTAVCFQCDTKMRLTNVPEKFEVGPEIAAVFAQRDVPSPYIYRDGVRLADGRFILLQDFPPGVGAYAEELLENSAIGERAKEEAIVR